MSLLNKAGSYYHPVRVLYFEFFSLEKTKIERIKKFSIPDIKVDKPAPDIPISGIPKFPKIRR